MLDKRISPIRLTSSDLEAYGSNLGSLFELDKRSTSISAVIEGPLLAGRCEVHTPRDGIHLFVLDMQLHHDMELSVEITQPAVYFALQLSGSCSQRAPRRTGWKSVAEFSPGKNFIGTYEAERSIFGLAGGQAHTMVEVRIDPVVARSMIESSETPVNDPLHPVLFRDNGSGAGLQIAMPPSLEDIAYQILRCPLEGTARQLFMESKTLEILALELDTFSRQRPPRNDSRSKQELDALELARHILEDEFDTPPSLVKLARRVGLNDFKLKRGFRQVYNTTVFGYVRRLRMEKARALLEAGDLNVTEVAMATGYNCFGHFSAAFKKHFGLLPSDLRKARTWDTLSQGTL